MGNDGKFQNPERPIQIRFDADVVTMVCLGNGRPEVRGESADLVTLLNRYIRDNWPIHGHLQNDGLRIALGFAKEFGGEVVNLSSLRAAVRDGWVRLLRSNLVGDPAQFHGERTNEFRNWQGLNVTIAAGSHHVLHVGVVFGAMFDLGDPEYLIIHPTNKKRWRARWESLTKVAFTYFEPPPDWLAELLTAHARAQKPQGGLEQGVADIIADSEEVSENRREQLMRELAREDEE